MKYLIILLSITVSAMAQRPTYAGISSKARPGLASRFRDPNDTDSTVINNRIAEPGVNPNIPVDARGDEDLVNKLNQWPREHRPFWLINAEHIERQRHPNDNQGQGVQPVQNQGQIQTQSVNFANRNNFDDPNIEIVNGIPGTFDKTLDGVPNVQSRGDFEQETIPAKPTPPRSSFLGRL